MIFVTTNGINKLYFNRNNIQTPNTVLIRHSEGVFEYMKN